MYGTTGPLSTALPAVSAALATPAIGAALGARGIDPLALPHTGGGGMALAAGGPIVWPLALATLLLAVWTLLMAARALRSLWPRAEA